MKYRACIFDLYGTLIPLTQQADDARHIAELSAVLEVTPELFSGQWRETTPQRFNGTFTSVRANIEAICTALGIEASEEQLAQVLELRQEASKHHLTLIRPETIPTLNQLRAMGMRIGLISDCAPNVPGLWETTPLAPLVDCAIFSCQAGMCKPDTRIYDLACQKLEVAAGECLYIGDGSSDELNGATRAGMTAVHLRVSGEEKHDRFGKGSWSGPSIASLTELIALIR